MWQGNALARVDKGTEIHPIERTELFEQGMIKFADTPTEIAVTELGKAVLVRFQSADFASKRY